MYFITKEKKLILQQNDEHRMYLHTTSCKIILLFTVLVLLRYWKAVSVKIGFFCISRVCGCKKSVCVIFMFYNYLKINSREFRS